MKIFLKNEEVMEIPDENIKCFSYKCDTFVKNNSEYTDKSKPTRSEMSIEDVGRELRETFFQMWK